MDLLYVLGKECQWEQHEELRHSIRSFKKNYPALGRIFVVGFKPVWLTNVTHIPLDNIYGANIPANIISKILQVCLTDISDDFIFCADDYFLLNPVDDNDLMEVINHGSYKNYKYTGPDYFSKVLNHTIQYLRNVKSRVFVNCESHTPVVLNKHDYLKIMLRVPYALGVGITPFTPYFNILSHGRFVMHKPVAYINHHLNDVELAKSIEGKRYMCITNGVVSSAFKRLLQKLYPEKTEFEQNSFELVRRKVDVKINDVSNINLDGCGIMLVAFGVDYEMITPGLVKSIRKFSDIPICVHTNIPEQFRSADWQGLTNVEFRFYKFHDSQNRVVKTQLGKYTTFKKTLYIDVDSLVVSGQFIELFGYLDFVDMVFPEWKGFNLPQLKLMGASTFNFLQFARIFERFSIERDLLVSGGICCFRKNAETDSFFKDFFNLWKWTGRKQDMPGLNGALFSHMDKLKYAFITKDKYNNTNSTIIQSLHSTVDNRLSSFTRTRTSRNGDLEYIRQGGTTFFKKPSICIVYDIDGWAFYEVAFNLKRYLNDKYSIDIVKKSMFRNEAKYDIVLCFSPGVVPKLMDAGKLICGISSHKESNIDFLNSGSFAFAKDFGLFNRLTCEHKYYTPNGVDTKFFKNDIDYSVAPVKSFGSVGSLIRFAHKGGNRLISISEKTGIRNDSLFIDTNGLLRTKVEMREYYKGLGVFVMSSLSETGPLTLLEAMSMGIPPVVNPTGLVHEIIEHGVNGFIVENYDSIDQYCDYIEQLLNNPSLYRLISENARTTVERYDWECMAKNYDAMINEFLNLQGINEKKVICNL